MYPKNKAKFDAWHKAMVAEATVDKPDYGKTTARPSKKHRRRRIRKSRKTIRRRKNG